MKIAVILGTSKSDGNTRAMVDAFVNASGATLFDLANYELSFFDYENKNSTDDFIPLVRELIGFDHLVFASPVYWYSMSAQLKVFVDRLSDLLSFEKALGRELKGKFCSVIATGYNEELPSCFVDPFEMTATYLQIKYKGYAYHCVQTESNLNQMNTTALVAVQNLTN